VGLTGAAATELLPPQERVRDVVLSAAWGMAGRWREPYDAVDVDRADALLRMLGVAALADRPFRTLSAGERKRVLIARALMPDPELLVLDEPGAELDLGAREDLVRRLSLLAADPAGPAVVLVTHHVEEIPPGFTHALLLRHGAVVAAGPLPEVIRGGPLSEAFGVPLRVGRFGDRYFAAAAAAR
jgi:iron complex transport system ATP-binding protein